MAIFPHEMPMSLCACVSLSIFSLKSKTITIMIMRMIEKKYVPINFFMIYRSRIERGSLKRRLGFGVGMIFFISHGNIKLRMRGRKIYDYESLSE